MVEAGAAFQTAVGDVSIEGSAFYAIGQAVRQTDGVVSHSFEDLNSVHVGASVG